MLISVAVAILGFPGTAATPTVSAETPLPHVYTKDELVSMVIQEADADDLNAKHMVAVIGCETMGTWDPSIQSNAYNATDPDHREASFGLVQIHLPAHPEVTLEQAKDPNFAIKWMASEWKAGRAGEWSCYHIEQDKGWR